MKRAAVSLTIGFMAGFILAVTLLFFIDLVPGVTWLALKKVLAWAGLGCYVFSWAFAYLVYRLTKNCMNA